MDNNEVDVILANRVINADRDLVDRLVTSIDEMKHLMIDATSTNIIEDVIAALKAYSNANQQTSLMLLELLGMRGGLAKTPGTDSIRLYDQETGVVMSGQMSMGIINKKEGEA